VSVVTASAFDADILSTALYVLGPEAGPEWADRHQVSALFLLKNGGLRTSSGFDALRPQILPGAHR
jgi:thiamine biosynthesis lipoprotein